MSWGKQEEAFATLPVPCKNTVNPKQSISSDTEAGGCTHSQHSEISLSPTKNTICHSVWKKRGSFGGHKTALVESDVSIHDILSMLVPLRR